MTHSITARIVNGFVTPSKGVDAAYGGNPAGVVLDADSLSEQQMLEIAQKVGLSETAFVSASETEGFKLDFFTPNRRIAHCGHATIATFSYLSEIGRAQDGTTSKETVDGPRKIILRDGAAYMEQLAPRYEDASSWADRGVNEDDVLASLGLHPDDLMKDGEPILVNTGNSFVVVGVKESKVLADIKPDQSAINTISEKLDLIGYYVFAMDTGSNEVSATTRMFAPRYAIEEESATGMAAGPLACLLYDKIGLKQEEVTIAQGDFMTPASPSIITVSLEIKDGKIASLMAGGYGSVMKEMEIRYD